MEYSNVDEYGKELIRITAPPECGKKVFQNKQLMMIIFSFFQSGWSVKYKQKIYENSLHNYVWWYDIFGRKVRLHQVTNRITNPYYDKGVSEDCRRNGYYVGPVARWASTEKKSKCMYK